MPDAQYIGHTSVFEAPEPGDSKGSGTPGPGSGAGHVDAIKLNLERLIG
jgi:hypothetical protein